MFEQADRTDPVERAFHIAVIHQRELDLVGNARFLRPLLAEGDLVGREGHAQHFRAVMLVEIQREAAPAAADIQHAQGAVHLARLLHVHLGGDMGLLVELGLFQADIGRAVIAHGVLPVLVEEQFVQAPRQVVGVLGILARLGLQVDAVDLRGGLLREALERTLRLQRLVAMHFRLAVTYSTMSRISCGSSTTSQPHM